MQQASQFRQVATPEGLRRLTSVSKFRTRRYAYGRLPEDATGANSMYGSGSIDLEAGRRGDGLLPVVGVLQTVLKALLRRCRSVAAMCGVNRRRWTGPVMALEALVIVALVLRVRRDVAAGAGGSMERCVCACVRACVCACVRAAVAAVAAVATCSDNSCVSLFSH